MRLVKVTGRPFIAVCAGCGRSGFTGDITAEQARKHDPDNRPVMPTWADLDGEPYRAYYCYACANSPKQTEHNRPEHCPGRVLFCPANRQHRDPANFGACRIREARQTEETTQ